MNNVCLQDASVGGKNSEVNEFECASACRSFEKERGTTVFSPACRFRGCYTPARLHRVPYPLRTAKCLRSSYYPVPRRVARKLTPPFLRRKIPRGAHSIIRYLCRDDHATHNRRKKKVSIGQEIHPAWSWRHSRSQPRTPLSVIAVLLRPSRDHRLVVGALYWEY